MLSKGGKFNPGMHKDFKVAVGGPHRWSYYGVGVSNLRSARIGYKYSGGLQDAFNKVKKGVNLSSNTVASAQRSSGSG